MPQYQTKTPKHSHKRGKNKTFLNFIKFFDSKGEERFWIECAVQLPYLGTYGEMHRMRLVPVLWHEMSAKIICTEYIDR